MAQTMVITQEDKISLFHMKAQLSALKLEIKGLCFRGGSVCAHIKRTYGIRARRKKDVARLLEQIIEIKETEGIFNSPE